MKFTKKEKAILITALNNYDEYTSEIDDLADKIIKMKVEE